MNDATQFFNTTAAGGYQIERSLRFNSSDSAYLSKNFGSAGNRKTWTWAGWVKRSNLSSSYQHVFNNENILPIDGFMFQPDNTLKYRSYNGSSENIQLITTQVFRDVSAWFHLVVVYDSTQGTTANRIKIYVNGIQVTSFSTATYPTPSYNSGVNNTDDHSIGAATPNTYSGYLADVHFIDGQALDPTSFGEFDTNGVWQPIDYAGTYGTNGFHLPFSDNSTAAALGTDTSGNSNTWTVNNISVTAGAGNDSLVDSPTNYGTDTGAGGEVRGNYATLNPLAGTPGLSAATFSNGNLDVIKTTSGNARPTSTIAMSSGKWYFEALATDPGTGTLGHVLGLFPESSLALTSNLNASGITYSGPDGQKYNLNVASSYGSTYTTGDLIGCALDLDNGKVWFSKNGVWQASGDPPTGTNPAFSGLSGRYFFVVGNFSGSYTYAWSANFGQRPFAYTAPSGFNALCTTNLPEPTIADGSTAMDVALYTGNGSTQTISGLNFEPSLVWVKARSAANSHVLQDVVRGFGSTTLLCSNATAEENRLTDPTDGAERGYISTATSSGFSIVNGTGTPQVNGSAVTYVAWTWDAGSTTVTNTQGSITSQVRANASAGFSIATFNTGASGVKTVGHGLNLAPQFFVIKSRSSAGQWAVYHSSAGADKYLLLYSTSAAITDSGQWVTAPTSSVFTFNSGYSTGTNVDYVGYFFSPVSGYSSFGSYFGDNAATADSNFVYLGFRPRYLMIKCSSSPSYAHWHIFDAARDTYNVAYNRLAANSSAAENSYGWGPNTANSVVDFLSNGFKIRTSGTDGINRAATYIYAAFAEHPFATARAR